MNQSELDALATARIKREFEAIKPMIKRLTNNDPEAEFIMYNIFMMGFGKGLIFGAEVMDKPKNEAGIVE